MLSFETAINQIEKQNLGFLSEDIFVSSEKIEKINQWAKEKKEKYKYCVVLGIGGSALGMRMLREAFPEKQDIQMYVLDNTDPYDIENIENNIDLKETLFLVITKSGGTMETISVYAYFLDKIKKISQNPYHHFVCITDRDNGFLREEVNMYGMESFEVPSSVGGRFSVLSNVGLIPAALLGIDIDLLLQGAKEEKNSTFSQDNTRAFDIAKTQYEGYEEGKKQTVLYIYCSRLFRLGDWYRQLLSESIGKKSTRNGEVRPVGITPLISLGSTDHHSQNQLYMEGVDDKTYFFIPPQKSKSDMVIPDIENIKNTKNECVIGKSFYEIISAQMKACQESLSENGRKYMDIEIPRITEYEIGKIIMMFELSIAFLGEMFDIDAFDQPGVERSKVITMNILNA